MDTEWIGWIVLILFLGIVSIVGGWDDPPISWDDKG